jgi:phosphatidylglycerophosphatase A
LTSFWVDTLFGGLFGFGLVRGKITAGMRISLTISTGFGAGYLPAVPGTWGSLSALIVWYGLIQFGSYPPVYSLLLALFITLAGLLSVRLALRSLSAEELQDKPGKIDPGFIVIDEWAGMLWSLVYCSNEWWQPLLAFVLFRLFDIIKPGPIRWAERLPREWGIMADDVLAGLVVLIISKLFF